MNVRTFVAAALAAMIAIPAIAQDASDPTNPRAGMKGAVQNTVSDRDLVAQAQTEPPHRRRGQREPAPEAPAQTPSATQIERQLNAPAASAPRRSERVTIREFKRRPDLRRVAPSIDIQSINFAFGSAEIPSSQYSKVENIADGLERLLQRRPGSRFLVEGHTDAVGSSQSNQVLSEARAASLKRLLVRQFGLPSHVLETVGYGEDYLLVQTPYEDWRNRRVTLRRIDDFVR